MRIGDKLDQIEKVINTPQFRENESISSETGYYIFDYEAKDEIIVRKYITSLVDTNNSKNDFLKIAIYDVYEILIELLENEGLLDDSIEMEKKDGMDYLIESITGLLQLEQTNNYFVNYIVENTLDEEVVFVVGIGKIFSFVSASKIFNSLHQIFDKVPVVIFYPGKYDGQVLKLFNEFVEDNHYRAKLLVKEA